MYHVSAQGVDERMINVHYYYYFIVRLFEYPPNWCTYRAVWLLHAAVSARSVYTIQSCTMPRHFMQRHIRRVYAYLDVTCHLHFCQNDQDLLRAAAVTRGWNGYRNKSTES